MQPPSLRASLAVVLDAIRQSTSPDELRGLLPMIVDYDSHVLELLAAAAEGHAAIQLAARRSAD